MGLVLVGDDGLILQVFCETRSVFLGNLFMACHLLKPVKFLALQRVQGVWGRLMTLIVCDATGRWKRYDNFLPLCKRKCGICSVRNYYMKWAVRECVQNGQGCR